MSWLRLKGVSVDFSIARGGLDTRLGHALTNITIDLDRGDTLALVGESGSGKSTLGRVIVQLLKPSRGRVLWDGVDLTTLNKRQLKPYRRKMQMVFQDARSAMNPRMTINAIVAEPLRLQGVGNSLRQAAMETLLERVGLDAQMSGRYPHECSGGELQRVALARALATNPELLVLDEPTSGLDVSIQARILNLLRALQKQSGGLGLIFISHDLAAVSYLTQRVAVLYLGHLVEIASTERLTKRPAHPYSAALLSALPSLVRKNTAEMTSATPLPRALAPSEGGCVFQARCPWAKPRCRLESPSLTSLSLGHEVACHYPLNP